MKNFFSIFFINLGTNFNEKISIGLLMSDGKKSFFKASHTKLAAIKGIISSETYLYVKSYLRNLEAKLDLHDDENLLYDKSEPYRNWLTPSYFEYLNSYSNNIISFSNIQPINLESNEENFVTLFQDFVFHKLDEDETMQELPTVLTKFHREFIPKISNHVNANFTVQPNDFEQLITAIDVGFIGKNGKIVAGQVFDFEKKKYNLENDVTKFISFSKAVDYSENKEGKYFVVGAEPKKRNLPNHNLWNNLRDSKMVDYVDISEVDKIESYLITNGVHPWKE